MVDAQRETHEVFDAAELRQLCNVIINECTDARDNISSSPFIASQRYPATLDGTQAWAEQKQAVIDRLTSTIEMLTDGARNEDLVSVARNMEYMEQALQRWGTLPENLRKNLHSLRNTITNIRNEDGLKEKYRLSCRSSIDAIRAIVNGVEVVCGLDTSNPQDIRRSLSLPIPEECENFARIGEAKGLKNLLEAWFEQLKQDAKPTDTFDPEAFLRSLEKPEPAPEQAIASAMETPQNYFMGLLRKLCPFLTH